jgi:hypothetical protein
VSPPAADGGAVWQWARRNAATITGVAFLAIVGALVVVVTLSVPPEDESPALAFAGTAVVIAAAGLMVSMLTQGRAATTSASAEESLAAIAADVAAIRRAVEGAEPPVG